MAERFFLGVDVGGSKTHALVAREDGQAVGFGQSGGGNHEMVGYEGFQKVLRESVEQALQHAGIDRDQIAGAGFGVAGYDWPAEREATLEVIATLGLQARVEAVNDAVIGLIAGTSEGWGVVVNAGTGDNVRGRDREGREVQVTGCGEAFGEHGGASDVVARAIQMISYEWYHRGPQTALTPAFIQRVGARDLFDLIEGLALRRYHISAEAAPLVFQVAEAGDLVARETIRWAASELGETACGVIRMLGLENCAFEVALMGSLFNGGRLYSEPLKQTILKTAPQAKFARLSVPPVVGAVLLGMEQAGLRDPAVRQRLTETAKVRIETQSI